MADATLTGKTFKLVQGTGLSGTLGAVLSGAIIFALFFALLFAFTGFTLFGLSGIFGVLAGIVFGLAAGAVLGLLFSFTTTKTSSPAGRAIGRTAILAAIGAIAGAVIPFFAGSFKAIIWGAVLGALLGIIISIAFKEETANSITSTIVTVTVVVALVWLALIWWQSGAIQLFFSPLGFSSEKMVLGIEKGIECMRNPVECFLKPFYDWSEPTIAEKSEEEINVRVDFSDTKKIFFAGENIIIKAAIIVKNPVQDFYVLEPKCFLNGTSMLLEDTPRIEDGRIVFKKSDLEQRVSVICKKQGGFNLEPGKEAKSFDFELHLIKDLTTKTEWNVYTLNKKALETKANPFEGINEPNLKGRIVLSKMEYKSPIKLSLGSDDDQPFSEGTWPFSIILRKTNIPGKVLNIKKVVLRNPQSDVVSIVDCNGFKKVYGDYYLDYTKLDKVKELINQDALAYADCHLSASPKQNKQVPEKTIIKAETEFDFESVYKRPITIISKIKREEIG
ncbi:hypothetical protein B6U80_00010 [Candidatus Pacearchaeota archaeon ex4484_26]|nr:MAG: hypothetical protein B6U80_00010 [Candidatus Pacearchaeota archaeon ex4484_26]